jgi:type IV secretory pathway component VirB8
MKIEEYIDISERVRSGEYFREVRRMVDTDLHDPMTDRYWYILISIPSLIIALIAFIALQSLYPLKPSIPFVFGINDIMEDMPRIKSLIEVRGEGADAALQRFLITNYVKEREEYNAATFDRNQIALQSLSTKQVLDEHQKSIALSNPQSPIVLYQRHTRRIVKMISAQLLEKPSPKTDNNQLDNRDYVMRITYQTELKPNSKENSATLWQVDVAFKYEPIKLNVETKEITPYGFLVTGYNTKPISEN